jgi:lipopolysaccharide export system protein LptC
MLGEMNSRTLVIGSNRAGAADARARAFLAARRHSQLVFAMRRALEIGVAGGLAALAVFALYRSFGHGLRDVSFDGIGIEGGRITMDKPRLSGSRPGGGGYNITAAKAMQDARRPGDVDLALIGGDISTPDRDVSRLSANSGHYDGAAETLDLSGDVRLRNSRYEIQLRSVRIAFKKGEYVSKEPVKVAIQPNAMISADSFSARDNGAEVRFEGHVLTHIDPAPDAPGDAP